MARPGRRAEQLDKSVIESLEHPLAEKVKRADLLALELAVADFVVLGPQRHFRHGPQLGRGGRGRRRTAHDVESRRGRRQRVEAALDGAVG